MGDNDLLVIRPLVVVSSGPARMGRLTAEIVVDRLAGLDSSPLRVVLPAELIDRPGERASVTMASQVPAHPATIATEAVA